jgi:hypothetical protein
MKVVEIEFFPENIWNMNTGLIIHTEDWKKYRQCSSDVICPYIEIKNLN